MTDIAGNRTLSSQWNETVQFYGNQNFLEYISVDDQLTATLILNFTTVLFRQQTGFIR